MMYNNNITKRYEKDYFDLYPILIISIIIIMILYKSINILLLISLLIFGIGLVCYYGKILYKIYNTRGWISESAKVINIEIETIITKDRWIETESYYPIFEYSFNFKGKKFSSKVFSIIKYDFPLHVKRSKLKMDNDDISKYLENIDIGSTIDIFINPSNPNESVVKKNASKNTLVKYSFLFFIGIFNIVYAIGLYGNAY